MTAFPTAITSSNAAPLLGFGGTPGVLDRSGVRGGGGGASWEMLARRLNAPASTTSGVGVDGGAGVASNPWQPVSDVARAALNVGVLGVDDETPGSGSLRSGFVGTPAGLTSTVAGVRGSGPSALSIKPGDEITPEQARKAAEEFVSMSLVQPVLAELRKMNKAYGAFAPGAHEKQFGPLMDAEIAMRMTKAQNFPLVDAVARNLLEYSQRRAPATQESKPGGLNVSVEPKATS